MHACMFFFGRYGISDYTLTQKLVEHAKTFPPSFDPLAPRKYYYHYYYRLLSPNKLTLTMHCTPPFLPFVTIIVLSKLINICSSICNTCALNRLKNVQHIIFLVIFFQTTRKKASKFFLQMATTSFYNQL